MNPLLAVAFVTPIWGFALHPPAALSSIAPEQVAQVRTAEVRVPPPDSTLVARTAHNDTMMDLTRGFQLAANLSMAVTAVFGAIQFGDEYGFHRDYYQTACATGDAVFNDYCGRTTPVAHLAAAGATAGLGATSFLISTQVDFDLAARRDGDWRTYEVTRWVELGMVAIQALGGFFIANAVRFGWANQQADFDVLQGFAIAHMAWGAATLGMETYNTALLF
jgi:hypothetical protein